MDQAKPYAAEIAAYGFAMFLKGLGGFASVKI